MTHTVHPYAHRIGILRDWKSRWFGLKDTYRRFLKADLSVREYLIKRLRGYYVGDIEIERSAKTLRIVIKTARPGLLIGRNGEGATKLKLDVKKFLRTTGTLGKEELKLDIEEIRSPESNAKIVSQMIADALEKRLPFRRVMKQMTDKVMANRDVKGVKIYLGGRLGGADMARREEHKRGRVPLQTFRSDIDFARERAHMSYGDIGIKVWIYKGEVLKKAKGRER